MTYVTVQEFITSLVLRNILSDIYCPFYGGDDEILDHILIHVPLKELYGLHQSHN